ncbi:MAG: GNAT family N-acetyltransferase [Candidatus Binatia bacterium]
MSTSSPLVGDIKFESVDHAAVSDADIEAMNAFVNVIQPEIFPEDPPVPLELTAAQMRNIPAFFVTNEYWARDPDGSIAATAYANWRDAPDNRHAAYAGVTVRPDRRRRGLARALLGLVVPHAEADGRTLLMGPTLDRVPAGEAFARRLRAERGMEAHTNRLVLADVDRELVRRWAEQGPGRAPGYSVEMIDGIYPHDMLEAMADLSEVMNTAPREDLELEDQRITPEQVREFERSMLAQGTEWWTLVARHDATGELAGYTQVFWNPGRPLTVSQGDTGVVPEHRGNALGKWLKAAMLERIVAERPQARDIRTGNADSNAAMLGINHALGFEPYVAAIHWQVPVERVRAYLEGSPPDRD